MKLLYDRILLRLVDQTNKTKGGLFLPDVALDGSPWRYAEVVAVGHGRIIANGEVVPLFVKEGDLVMFFRDARGGDQLVIPVGDEELLIAREVHVGMIVDKSTLERSTGLIGTDGTEVRTRTLAWDTSGATL